LQYLPNDQREVVAGSKALTGLPNLLNFGLQRILEGLDAVIAERRPRTKWSRKVSATGPKPGATSP
jgi:hypothetical protein